MGCEFRGGGGAFLERGCEDGAGTLVFVWVLPAGETFVYLRSGIPCGGLLCAGGLEYVHRAGAAANDRSVASVARPGSVCGAGGKVDAFAVVVIRGESAGQQ